MDNRRNFLKQGSLAASAILFLKPLEIFASPYKLPTSPDVKKLTILHTSNLNFFDGSSSMNVLAKNIKGINTAVNKIVANNSNVLLVNSGNFMEMQNGVEEIHQKHFKALSKIGYDAIITGKSDIANGATYFAEMANDNGLNVVATSHKKTINSKGLTPYHIVSKGDIKVGIISNSALDHSCNDSVNKIAHSLNQTASHLKENHNCDIVVCLSYNNLFKKNTTPLKNDIALAKLTKGIDVLISGNNKEEKVVNHVFKNMHKQEVIVGTSGVNGSMIGRIDITFNDQLQKNGMHIAKVNAA